MKKQIVNYIPEYEDLIDKYSDRCSLTDKDTYEKYYRLYEYTDDICVLEDNPLYPGLTNYVKTGLLTKEEMIEALLFDT